MTEKIEHGHLCKLRSGGPLMVISRRFIADSQLRWFTHWFDENSLQEADFHIDELFFWDHNKKPYIPERK